MNCADAGLMQAYLDGECSSETSLQISEHVSQCEQCRQLMAELSALDAWTRETMEQGLFRGAEQVQVDTEAAWQRFADRLGQNAGTASTLAHSAQKQVRKRSWKNMNKTTKRWVTGASAAAVLAVSLSFPQVQAAASDFLSIFRMDKVEFVKVTQDDLQQVEAWMSSGKAGEMELKGIGKISIKEDGQKDKEARMYDSREDAEKAGVKLPKLPKLPQGLDVDSVEVRPAFTVQLEVNVEKANKLLAQLAVDQRFDEKLDGKPFELKVPEMHSIWLNKGKERLNYTVVDTPELQAPEGVDLEQLRETILSLPFIPDNVKKQMLGIKDWQHTLPVPYMTGKDSKMKEVRVHGASAILRTSENYNQIVWQQDGRIHMLEGSDTKADDLLQLAGEME
ncbi:anti-sigma factor family protein [Brevibacillus sp. GCM10020057]|uniref:anti-sigma factor family protein n=1 Tax=Brevibacillus sp. GCM10020057 TaxID=3317327 RepID=UPI00362C1766